MLAGDAAELIDGNSNRMGPLILCLLHMWVGCLFSGAWKQLWVKFRRCIQNEHSAPSLVSAPQSICLLLAFSHLSQERFYISIHVYPPLLSSLSFCLLPSFLFSHKLICI